MDRTDLSYGIQGREINVGREAREEPSNADEDNDGPFLAVREDMVWFFGAVTGFGIDSNVWLFLQSLEINHRSLACVRRRTIGGDTWRVFNVQRVCPKGAPTIRLW